MYGRDYLLFEGCAVNYMGGLGFFQTFFMFFLLHHLHICGQLVRGESPPFRVGVILRNINYLVYILATVQQIDCCNTLCLHIYLVMIVQLLSSTHYLSQPAKETFWFFGFKEAPCYKESQQNLKKMHVVITNTSLGAVLE